MRNGCVFRDSLCVLGLKGFSVPLHLRPQVWDKERVESKIGELESIQSLTKYILEEELPK